MLGAVPANLAVSKNVCVAKKKKPSEMTDCANSFTYVIDKWLVSLMYKELLEVDRASLVAQTVKNPPAMQETWV